MSLERKKLELVRKRVQLGVDELEFRVLERSEDIKRIQESIKISEIKIKELDKQLEDLKG